MYLYLMNNRPPTISTISRTCLPLHQEHADGKPFIATRFTDANRARLLLLGASALYGTNFSFVKLIGRANIPVGASSTLRFGMAALTTFPCLLKSEGLSTKEQWMPILLGCEIGLYNAMGYVAQAIALKTTSASNAAFLCSLVVIVVPFLDFCKGKCLSRQQLFGTFMAIVGVGLLQMGNFLATGNATFALSSGDWANILQPICFGMGFWRMEHLMAKYPSQAKRSTAAQLLIVFLVCWAFSALAEPGALQMEQVLVWLSDAHILFGVFWTGCISTALTVFMETVALKSLSAAETTLIFSTEPIWGAAFAAALIDEHLGIDRTIGAVLILLGCVSSNLGRR
ncbi:hypothetical protein MPSEU_000742700 [Mayamaea pseudoterrestris]|nr:hypothetical protein MPSEU_000742700 [Mayamaea pseudoterrestris]